MKQLDPLRQIAIGNGGWVRLERTGQKQPFMLVRFVDAGGQLRVRELYLDDVTDHVLETLSLRGLEDYVNLVDPAAAEAIRARLNLVSPDLRAVANWYSASGRDFPEPPPSPHRTTRPRDVRAPSAHVQVPSERPYPEEFFDQVAVAYRSLDAAGIAPAPAIALASAVPVTTAHRWIRRAGELGKLSQPGAGHRRR